MLTMGMNILYATLIKKWIYVNLGRRFKWNSKIIKNLYLSKLCNVEIVKEVGANSLRMKVYENGVGETKACATGACASAYIGLITKRSGN